MKIRIIPMLIMLLFFGQQFALAQKTEKRDVSAFTEVSLRNDAKVILTQGKTPSVSVKAKESTLEKLITEVKDRKLIIRYPSESWFKNNWNPGEVEVYITMPQIDGLSLSGSGSIIADSKIETLILEVALSGSGSVKIGELQTEKFSATLSGSGSVNIAGKQPAAELKAIVSGSGNVKAIDFPAKKVDVKIAGSGNCYVQATENLTAKIAGSGNVIYRGNPSVDSSVAGSGSVKEER